jgi:hypothetical protein
MNTRQLRLVTPVETGRYSDLRDQRLAAVLAAEDVAEETDGLSPHERISCHLHRRWTYQCVASPQHAIPVTGHRWCRRCNLPLTVAVDEFGGSVSLSCPRCAEFPNSVANRQVARTCRASLAAARHDDALTGVFSHAA